MRDFIDKHRGVHGIGPICQVLQIAPSGYRHHAALGRDPQRRCGMHRIERLMRAQALRAWPRRRGLPKDHGERSAIADDVLDRQFQADAPNQKWVADDFSHECVDIAVDFGISGQYLIRWLDQAARF